MSSSEIASQSRSENEITKTGERMESQIELYNDNIVANEDVNEYASEDSDFYDDEYWSDYEYDIRAESTGLPKQCDKLKHGKVVERRGSNQDKFTSSRPKKLVKYGSCDVPALDGDVDEEAKEIIKKMVEDYHYFNVINDVVRSGERSVLIHCYSRIDEETGKPIEYLLKVYRLQFGLDRINKWAMKEYQMAHQMWRHTNVPNVYCPYKNVVTMCFIGDDGIPAPSLKDLDEVTEQMYSDVITNMYKLYNDGEVVHGKLSARNILWWRDKVWFISLSASVMRSHPNALKMLMKDCCHVTHFFKTRGLAKVKSIMNLFKYITGLDKIDDDVIHVLRNTRKPIKNRKKKSKKKIEEDDDEIFET